MKVESSGYHFVHNINPFMINRTSLPHHIVLLVHSPIRVSINNQPPVECNGRCAILLKKDTPRNYTNVNGIPLENDFIQFSSNSECDFEKYGLTADTVYQNIPPVYMNTLSRIISNIVQENRDSRFNSSSISDLYLDIFLYTLGQFVNAPSQYDTDHPLFKLMYDARNHLLRNFQSNPDIKQVAKNVGISQYYFRRMYKEIFKSTPQYDIIETRIHYACWLLQNTDDTVTSISNECGYHSDEHFMRQFKQVTALTPSEYRKKNSEKIFT